MKTLISLFCVLTTWGVAYASPLQSLRPCTSSSPFTAQQKPAYQPLKLAAPLVGYCLTLANNSQERVCMQGLCCINQSLYETA